MPETITPTEPTETAHGPADHHDPHRWRSHQKRQIGPLTATTIVVICRMLVATPTGIDAGIWLSVGRQLLGDGHRPDGALYPPIVPLVTLMLDNIVGIVDAASIMGLISCATITFGTASLCRRHGGDTLAQCLTGCLAGFAGITGEAIAWGGYPQTIALGVLAIVGGRFEQACRSHRRDAVICGMFCAIIAWTSHLVLAQTAIVIVSIATCVAVSTRSFTPLWRAAQTFAVCAAAIAAVGPVYLSLAGIVGTNMHAATPAGWDDIVTTNNHLFRHGEWFWTIGTIGSVLGLLIALGMWGQKGYATAVGLWAAALLPYAASGEQRYCYAIAISLPATITIVWAAGNNTRQQTKPLLRGTLGVCMVWACIAGVARYDTDSTWYALGDDSNLELIEWVTEHTAADDIIAAPSIGTFPFGWWVEGVGNRRVITLTRETVLFHLEERDDAKDALAIFDAGNEGFPSSEGLRRARERDVKWIVVPWAWAGSDRTHLVDRNGNGYKIAAELDGGMILELATTQHTR